MILSYEDFFNTVWDYVSGYVVNDDLWEAHLDTFYDMTFDIYNIYVKASTPLPGGERQEVLTPKLCAKMVEIFISNFKNSISC